MHVSLFLNVGYCFELPKEKIGLEKEERYIGKYLVRVWHIHLLTVNAFPGSREGTKWTARNKNR